MTGVLDGTGADRQVRKLLCRGKLKMTTGWLDDEILNAAGLAATLDRPFERSGVCVLAKREDDDVGGDEFGDDEFEDEEDEDDEEFDDVEDDEFEEFEDDDFEDDEEFDDDEELDEDEDADEDDDEEY